VKPTHLGLKLDKELCLANLRRLLGTARRLGNFVRIDMEDSSCTDDTLAIYDALRPASPNLGVVIQACLRRSREDVARLAKVRANVRLCKGIYVEPRRIAYREPRLVRKNFTLLLDDLFRAGCHVGIATHDEELVWDALRLIEKHGIPRDRYEFQMLLGVDEELRGILRDAGHRLRVYVPFGTEWYAYSTRRLKENPEIAGHILRNLFRSRRS
jgi:proline dehydrogenase